MQYRKTQKVYVVRLERGEKLIECLNGLAEKENLSAAWLHGLGGAESVELGFYNLETRQYQWRLFEELMEITSLQGNLAWIDGQPKWHVHGTFSDRDYRVIGGHVKELTVGGTCEIGLHIMPDTTLQRQHDESIGLDLLDLS